MHLLPAPAIFRVLLGALAVIFGAGTAISPAHSEALLLVDTDSGRVLHAENAAYPWYPASTTKLMTTYVTLRAVKEGRIKLDSLVSVSANALAQKPSKMGFPVGTRMTVDNALKMMMVKSANDIAVVLAEGVSGSIDAFAEEMNRASRRLGMTQSNWVNPNGLPDDRQVTSARDMAILARALMREFPQYAHYWHTPAIRFGKRVMRNYNKLIGRYPGADGMKTGFICAAGYNLVATATRGNKHLIAVVFGAPSGRKRAETAARLLETGFNGTFLSWLAPSLGTVDSLQPIAASPPDLRDEICGKGRRRARKEHTDEDNNEDGDAPNGITAFASMLPGLATGGERASLLGPLVDTSPPVRVTVIAPPGSSADPEALASHGRKKKGVIRRHRNGRKSVVIPVSRPSPKAKTKHDSRRKRSEPAARSGTRAAKPARKGRTARTRKPAAGAKSKSAATQDAKR